MANPLSGSPDLSKLSLAMIVKDETVTLRKCLESVAPHVDEIVVAWNGSSSETRAILEEFGCRIEPYEWKDDFAEARNFAFSKTAHELVFWLDADDTVVAPERLHELLVAFADPRVGSVWLPYYYDFDEYGHPCMILWRERITRKSWWTWKRRIHEVQQPIRDCSHVREDRVIIRHQVIPERVQQSAARNLRIAQAAYQKEKEGGDLDPVTVYDYARALKAGGQFKESLEVFREFVEKSGFDDDRYEALCSMADIYRKFRWYDEAQNADFAAVKLRPRRPEGYFGLAKTAFCLEDWDNVLWYTDIGYKCPEREDNMPVDPIANKARPLLPLQFALFQKGRFALALQVVQKALKFFPKNQYLKDCASSYEKAIAQEQLEKSLLHVYDALNQDGEQGKLTYLARAIPDIAKDHPLFVRLANRFRTPEGWQNKIVIYCGTSYELWDPLCVGEGVGGSEEAVISLAPLLVKLGWQVEVYNNCLEEGNYDGVLWKPFWTYDRSQRCAVFIAWRDSRSVLLAPEGSFCVAWLHDRQKPEYWSEAMLQRLDALFVLSKYHRTDMPQVPDERVLITANGIHTSQFRAQEPRDSKRCIYASSPDRGLDILLELWPQIREQVPEAELHVFYGFSKTYEQLHKNNQQMKEFRDSCLKMMQQPGVVYHGRVGHAQLAKEFLRSAIWTYPTYFTEISCITAMKAQAAGAIPVTMALAALNETVKYGYKLSFTVYDKRSQLQFVQSTVGLLQDPEKQEKIRSLMVPWAMGQFDWQHVAKQWSTYFEERCRTPAVISSATSSPTA
jgi:glycosyltransferase involved in cell wall biosynthesis